MDGVTVVDHVLLRRLLSILRSKDTTHRVFRETLTDAALILGYEAMRGLRGADVEIDTRVPIGDVTAPPTQSAAAPAAKPAAPADNGW